MAVKIKSIGGRVSALTLALAALSLPAAAQAQQEGVQFRDNEATGNIGGGNEARRAARSAPHEDRGWSAPARTEPQSAPAGDYQQGRAAQAPGWNRSAERREGNGWNGAGRSGWRDNAARPAPAPQPRTESAPTGRNWRDDNAARSGNWSRQEGRSGYREADRKRQDYRRDSNRQWDRRWDSNRNRQVYSQDHRRWDNGWRDNRRYDWSSYRRAYPSAFRLGAYYSPYRNYSYRRLSIGFFLDSLFFSNRYWINDPWRYRLPDVYGPYRWVRYYDDALLVNTYTGEVADVIYSFFW